MLNSQSLIKHHDEIKYFIEVNNPLVMCLTESHVTSEIDDFEIAVTNYNIERVNSESRHTGGVIFYIRSDIKYSVCFNTAIEKNLWFLVIKIRLNNDYFTLAGVYHSPNHSHIEFINFLENWLNQNLLNISHTFLMFGDFNINWSSNLGYCNRLKSVINDFGLKQMVNSYTHMFGTGGSIIDLVITNSKNMEVLVLDEPNITDHSIIAIGLPKVNECKTRFIRSKLSDGDIGPFQAELSEFVTNFNYRSNVNEKYNLFSRNVIKIIDKFMPKKEVMLHGTDKGWFNEKVLNAIKQRDESYKIHKSTGHQIDWEDYKLKRNKVVDVVRTEKCRFFENKIDFCRGDSKMMWKSLKTIISCKNREVVSEVMFGTEILNDMNHIVERFNEFYINSVSEIVNEIPKNDRYYQIEHNYNRFTNFHLLDKCELKTIIFSLANKSSPDDIGMIFYKDFFDVLADPLLNIINTSLQVGVVPDALKISTIVIIRKVAKTIKAEEFRPINMLAAIEKILEKVVYVQILQFVIENNLICKFQSGFREGHSCESALQYVINEWKEACDLGKVTGIVFLDLKRAFETVDRDRLLKKLKEYGLDGAVHKWLCSYLSGRMQKVKYDEYVSTASSINVGIPQGSILGPLLFILYINDMADLFSNCCYHLFADTFILRW